MVSISSFQNRVEVMQEADIPNSYSWNLQNGPVQIVQLTVAMTENCKTDHWCEGGKMSEQVELIGEPQ